jgi:hypothetical protein
MKIEVEQVQAECEICRAVFECPHPRHYLAGAELTATKPFGDNQIACYAEGIYNYYQNPVKHKMEFKKRATERLKNYK